MANGTDQATLSAVNPANPDVANIVQMQNLSALLSPGAQPSTQTGESAGADQTAPPQQPQRDLTKEPIFIVHAGHYGYKDDPNLGADTKAGQGAFGSPLAGGSTIRLSPDLEQRFGASPGETFNFTDRSGQVHPFKFGDRTNENVRGRIEVYDADGSVGELGQGTISRPGAQGSTIPALETSNTEIQKQPAAFGMRVATPDDVTNYDNYIKNGGDPNAIPAYDRLAVAIAKDPFYLSRKENFDTFYSMVYRPLQAQSHGDVFQNWAKNLGPTLRDTVSNIGQGLLNQANLTKDQAELFVRKVSGNVWDPGYQSLTSRLANETATSAAGIGEGISDAYNFVVGTYGGMWQIPPAIAGLFAHDPQSREQIDRARASIMQDTVNGQQYLANLAKDLQTFSGTAYKALGDAALGQKIQSATPNQAAASGIATIANPLNYIGGEAGEAVSGVFRPLYFEKGMQSAEEAAGALAKKAALDTTQILPERPEINAANPAYNEVRNVQANLAPEVRNATVDANTAQAALNQRLTSLNKIAGDPGTATSLMSGILQGGGNVLQTLGDWASKAGAVPEMIANRISGGNPMIKGIVQEGIKKYAFGTALHHLGPIGGFAETAIEHLPELADSFGGLFKTMGKELMFGENTIPYWQRVAQENKLMPKGMAQFLDSPVIATAGKMAGGAIAGAGVNATLGGLQEAGTTPGGGLAGALGGVAPGAILGAAGGGLGQIQRFRDPNQYLLQARGDWKRYRDTLVPNELKNFDQLAPTNQLLLAQSSTHFPGLKVNYVNDPTGVNGFHYFDSGGRSNIQINLANPDSVIRGITAHELIHGATHAGNLPDLYDSLFGNPNRGTLGQYTALNADGTPLGVDPATGRYYVDQNFNNLMNQYTNKLAQNGVPTAHLTTFDIAKEIYAEHGVDYMLSGAPILDANSAFRPGLVSPNAIKTALMKQGFTFSEDGKMIGAPGGTIGGTGLFTDLQRNEALMGMAKSYFRSTQHEGMIDSEEDPTFRFTRKDMQNPNTAERLNTAAEIVRDPVTGAVKRNPLTGEPIYRTPTEVKEYNANFANAVKSGLEQLSPDQRMDLGYRETVNEKGEKNIFVRYLPDNILDNLAGANQYNPHQIAALKLQSRVLADKGQPGMEARFFYHKALGAGKRYGQFEGTEKIAVPYGFEITHDNNVNLKSVDFNQLNKNYQRVARRDPYKSLWDTPDAFVQDVHTYFTNHSQGKPGAEGIGEQKRDAINALANFGTTLQRDVNPLVGEVPNAVRSIIKSYRIDRTNQFAPTGAVRPFISEDQYHQMNRNYLPGAAQTGPALSYLPRTAKAAPAPPDTTAIPVTTHTTASGKVIEDKIPYGITSAPLVSDKQPRGALSENNFGHVDYLTKPQQQKLTYLDKASAVTSYADRLVAEFQKIKDNPSIMAGKNWYKDVRKLLKKGFGKDAELFAQLLGATSAGQGVANNWNDALVAYHRYRSGAFDDAIREYKRTGQITEDMKPTKADGSKFFTNSDEVLKVLAGTWMDEVQGPKTPNFFANLFGRGKEATIDKWAARTMRRLGFEGVEGAPDQWRLQPKSETGVNDLDFAFSQQVFRQAAERVGMDPHELQAVMWFAEKDLWANKGWSPKGSAAAEKSSYIPQLKAYVEHVSKTPSFKEVSPEEFIAGRNTTLRPGFLSDLKPDDLRTHKLFTNQAGTVGAAVDQNGDLQNVFNNSGVQGAGAHAIIHAINNLGARTLDAFDGHLPHRYAQFGFQETGRAKFDPAQAPANWNYKEDDQPDVVFMKWNGYPAGGEKAALGRAWDKTTKSWIPATRAQ